MVAVSLSAFAGAGAQFLDTNGNPLQFGFVYSYAAGTTTPAATYTSSAASAFNQNPIELDGSGRPPAEIWLVSTANYKFVVTDATASDARTFDNISGIASAADLAQFIADLATSDGADEVGFSQTASYAQGTVGLSLQRESYAKDAPFNAVFNGSTNDTTAIQACLADASGGIALLPAGTAIINGTLTMGASSTLRGAGPGVTILKKTGSGHILDILGTSNKPDITIEGITFDVNNVDSAIVLEYVENLTIRNCNFKNMRNWGINLGKQVSASSTIVNTNILIENCHFDTSISTLEQLLLFNSSGVTVRDCTFANGASSANGIGLYQNLDDVLIDGCRFGGLLARSIFYSLSTNNIRINDCNFNGVIGGVIGANQSDNGAFGYTTVRGLNLTNSYFTGCTTPWELGATTGALVEGCTSELNLQAGCTIFNAHTPAAGPSIDFIIDDCHFIDNNVSNIGSTNAPAILFTSVGGSLQGQIKNCVALDTRGTPRQLFAIVFSGAFTWSDIQISGCALNGYSGGTSVFLANSAVLGANVSLDGTCQGITTTLAAGLVGAVFSGSATYDPPSLADGAGATTTVTVTGATLGDYADATFSLDLQGITVTAWVSAANTVSVRFQNESGGTLDLASGTLRARTVKAS